MNLTRKMKIKEFKKGKFPKKYTAILVYKENGKEKQKKVSFGDARYQQYEDKVPLKLYSHLDHKDPNRRRLYYARHGMTAKKHSPKWFSHKYLW